MTKPFLWKFQGYQKSLELVGYFCRAALVERFSPVAATTKLLRFGVCTAENCFALSVGIQVGFFSLPLAQMAKPSLAAVMVELSGFGICTVAKCYDSS
jgi:hypothetical protein